MRKIDRLSIAALFAIAVYLTGAMAVTAQRPTIKRKTTTARTTRTAGQVYTVNSGTTMRVRMNETISSKTAKVGDRFTATVTEPVYSSTGVVVVPTGSTVTGRVDSVQPAAKGGKVGQIDASFVSVNLPNGTSRSINGSLADLDTKSAKSDNEGTASGDKTKHRKVIFIGGGGAGGAILGGAIGGGKGALIGGIIGGVGGLIAERSTRGEEATVKSGSEFGVYLNQSVSLPRFTESGTPAGNEYPTNTGSRTYIVQPGDTLGKISIRFYGTSSRYMEIYDANRDRLASPSSIEVGQELVIP